MSDIVDTFSPPFAYGMVNGKVARFKRMLSEEWAGLIVELRAEREEIETLAINKQVGEKDVEQRARARGVMKEIIANQTTLRKVVYYATEDIDGIDRLLKFTLIDSKWADVAKLIPPLDKMAIANEIAHRPIVMPENPSSPAGSPTKTATGGRKKARNGTGATSAPPSSPSSQESTPAS